MATGRSLQEIEADVNKLISVGRYTIPKVKNIIGNFDERYLNPKNWNVDDFGNVTNTWARLYILDENNAIATSEVIITGVSINVSKSPVVIEKRVKGFNSPIFQQYTTNSYDIGITFLESGPAWWQQNSKNIIKLISILNSGVSINIYNPQLSLIYGVNKVVITNYNIGQDSRFYSHNNISLSFKSDDNIDILRPIETT